MLETNKTRFTIMSLLFLALAFATGWGFNDLLGSQADSLVNSNGPQFGIGGGPDPIDPCETNE